MATYTYTNNVFTASLTASEAAIVSKVLDAIGPNALGLMFDTYLAQQAAAQAKTTLNTIQNALPNATTEQVASIQSTLGV